VSAQQASQSKVAVKPVELENAKEPPLNLYKPKEPYTATIVSVERLVGPEAPGETCHIVIDHGGNVPYWEGQSYGVIPPVSISSLFILHVLNTNIVSLMCGI
jgi:ferredoxin--NADP+ reductase